MGIFKYQEFIKNSLNESVTESFNLPGIINIGGFISSIRIPSNLQEGVKEWWDLNRKRINLHYFRFRSNQPIMGCFFGTSAIAINEKPMVPPEIKLFIALHESKHADQHLEGRFSPYFDTVKDGDREGFLRVYSDLEREANLYAISSMREMGFGEFMDFNENRLRGNEGQGQMVYQMMESDIDRFDAKNMFDLLINQVV